MVTMKYQEDILYVYLGCVHSQLAGEALATTTEPHLTNRLAPAGG